MLHVFAVWRLCWENMALKIKTEHIYTTKLGHFMPFDSMVQFLNFYLNLFYFLQLERI